MSNSNVHWRLVMLFALLSTCGLEDAIAAPRPALRPSHPTTTKSLDLTRVPSVDDLIAAGQLGGPLFPTHELNDQQREQAAQHDFGNSIEEWNKHEYKKAVGMFRKHVEQFPDSPWAAEAILHIGCDATYNGRYTEAEAIFKKLITDHEGKDHEGARMMLGKVRQRLALLKVNQNNLDEATELFTSLRQSPDWRHRTYAAHWLQRNSRYKGAQQALLTCGVEALAYALERKGHRPGIANIRTNTPPTMRGHSLTHLLRLATNHGYEMAALEVDLADLRKLPLPAVLHIDPQNDGDKGHYWVLDKVEGNQVEVFDPQSEHRFHQTFADLAREWTGRVIVFSSGVPLPGRRLLPREMDDSTGGCCGAPRPEDDQGDPCKDGKGGPGCNNPCSEGAPRWSVNVLNLNMFVTDTPLWYDPPIGPAVRISVSYNSQSAIAYSEPFGNKWQFNLGSYLIMDTAGTVIIFMPDGRRDTYTPDGDGGFRPPYGNHNRLILLGPNYYELRMPDDSAYVYRIPSGTSSQQPFLVEIRDAYTNRLSLGYDANVRLTTITAADGKVFTLSYNAVNLCTNVADPFGRSASFEYDVSRNLRKITDMGGYWSTLSYDSNVFLTSLGNDRGTTYFYTEIPGPVGNSDNYPPPGDPNMFANYRITITNALGGVEEYMWYAGCDQDGYNGCAGYTWHVQPRDYVAWKSQTINNYRLRVPKTRYIPTITASGRRGEIGKVHLPEGGTEQYTYDANGNRSSATDTHGHTWQYGYNSLGRVTSVTDANGISTAFMYAANGVDLLSVSNGLGDVRMTYNAQHDLSFLIDRLTNSSSFIYSGNGQIIVLVDALGITNEYLYGPNQRLAEFRRGGQTLERFTYDGVGRVRTRTDATGLTVTNDYNALNQVVRVTYPDGRFESYAYSTCCPRLLDRITDRGGRTTVFIYDALKRLTQIVNPEGGIIKYGYDANGNHSSLTDPNGSVTTFSYDLDDRITRKTYADGKGLNFRYDPDGLLTARTNARGITTTYSYDANHNLLTTAYSDDTPGVTNTYDAFDRLTLVKDGVGTNAFGYDANSSVRTYDGPWANDGITYTIDGLGRRTNMLVQGGQAVSYAYDVFDRLRSVRVGGAAFDYAYQGVNPLVQGITRPNGSVTTNAYDTLNRLTRITTRRGDGQIIHELSYTYSGQDMVGSELLSNGVPSAAPSGGQVTSDYNRVNQILTATPPGSTFTHDADGNLTGGITPAGKPFVATFDAEDRLKSIVVTNDVSTVFRIDYRYLWNGLVAEEAVYQNGGLIKVLRRVRDGFLSVQERDSSGNVTRELAWGAEIAGGVGGLLQMRQGGQNYTFTYDNRGNVTAVLDGSQTMVAAYKYDPFGVVLARTGSLDQPYQFATKAYNEMLGLSDFGFRFYSPAAGRWMSRDPLAELGGLNLYGYVGNNPVNFIDPTGELAWFIAPILGGLIGGGIDLGLQLLQNGGRWECVSWGQVGLSAGLGALFSSLGPSGAIFGRGGSKAAQLGYKGGIFNRGATRIGWSWNKGRNWFSIHGGKPYTPSHWHFDLFPGPTGPAVGGFGIGGGIGGGAAGAAAGGGGCDCK